MRATIQDVWGALTFRNLLIFLVISLVTIIALYVFGYLIWRRLPIPSLIMAVAIFGWRIGRRIGHAGLSKILNAGSVGLGSFGVTIWTAAMLDGWLFPVTGYSSWTVHVIMWAWILYHVFEAWKKLNEMPPDRLIHVTEGTEAIYAQMTYREARSREAREAYEKAKEKLNFSPLPV